MINFTTINHEAREKLDLSWLEYGLADLIYNLSNNPKSDYPGWCYASKEKLGETLGISKQSVHSIINRLIKKGLLERHKETKHLRITVDWYKKVLIKDDSKESLPLVKKVYSDSKESLPQHSKESLHNKDINNKDINKDIKISSKEDTESDKKNSSKKSLSKKKTSYGNPDINLLIKYFKEQLNLPTLDDTVQKNRRYCQLAINKFGGPEKVKELIDITTKSDFWANKITSFVTLYYKGVRIVSETRENKSKIGFINPK